VKQKKRMFCPHCRSRLTKRDEEGNLRDYCETCEIFFYDNPLPVVSTILAEERNVLLVKRGNRPYRGKWCLPSGFAETDETIEDAALRELKEETGVEGEIVGLVDVDSCGNYFYGDLIFITFEAVQTGGRLSAGSDGAAVKYFPLERVPRLAFSSNSKAIRSYVRSKSDYWAIADSFALALDDSHPRRKRKNLLSDRLVEVVQENAETIARSWLRDVRENRSTPGYHTFDQKKLFARVHGVLSQVHRWLGGFYSDRAIRDYYMALGKERRGEGFNLHEVLSALSLTRKYIWEFALSYGVWTEPIDIYMVLELEGRLVIFFDKATFYTALGYM
jgi:8-oxo-dGTP diphosphatase